MLRAPPDIPQQDWDAAKAEARACMIETSKKRRLMTYSDLVGKVTAVKFDPFDGRLFHLLGEISSKEFEAGRGMLTAVVVRKEDGEPGDGFYELARSLHLDTRDKLKCWSTQVDKVYSVWT